MPVPDRETILLAVTGAGAYGLAVWLRAQGRAVVVEEAGRNPVIDSSRARGFAHVLVAEGDTLRSLDPATGVATQLPSIDALVRLLSGPRP